MFVYRVGLGCPIPGDPPGKLVRKRCFRLCGSEEEEGVAAKTGVKQIRETKEMEASMLTSSPFKKGNWTSCYH